MPELHFSDLIEGPWRTGIHPYGIVLLMGFLVNATCGLLGNYLILRRMALVGDAISHSILPGIAIAFLVAHSLEAPVMFLGAVSAGLAATFLIELIHGRTKVKADAAIGITFCTLFAIGVILINVFAGRIDLDADCVLYGDLNHLASESDRLIIFGVDFGVFPVAMMGIVSLLVVGLIVGFYKELLLSSFDPALADALGYSPRMIHYLLMGVLSLVVVGAFEAVGAILVIAMLILPGATAMLLTTKLPRVLVLSVVIAAIASVAGLHLAVWIDVSIAAAMVVAGSLLFGLAWLFSPSQGLILRWIRRIDHSDLIPEDELGNAS